MKLWLDDIRPAPEGWVWAKTYDAAVAALQTIQAIRETDTDPPTAIPFTHMSFDHDLADTSTREKTGYDVALWMAENNVWPTVGCRVHSFNPVGARRIQGVIDRYGPYDTPCVWAPELQSA